MRRCLFLAICLLQLSGEGATAQAVKQKAMPSQRVKHARATPKDSPQGWGDLLQKYATKPAGVTLIKSAKGTPGSQTVAVALYKVSGASALTAEQFFQQHYGMGNLTFVCCGWEPENGKTGQVTSATLRKLNPNYVLLITMYSDAQAIERAMIRGDTSAWRNKRKVRQFLIEVKLLDV